MTNIENYQFSKSTLALWGKKDVIKFGDKSSKKRKDFGYRWLRI